VCVETGDFIGASTDSDVYIAMFGDKGQTGLLEIGANDPTVFDIGSVDNFSLHVGKDLGDIKKIHIVKAEGGLKDDWYVNKITISRGGVWLAREDFWMFKCDNWIQQKRVELFAQPKILVKGKMRYVDDEQLETRNQTRAEIAQAKEDKIRILQQHKMESKLEVQEEEKSQKESSVKLKQNDKESHEEVHEKVKEARKNKKKEKVVDQN